MKFIVLFCCLTLSHGAEFNEAFAASVVSNIEQLVTIPWSRVNNILFSAFNSKWSLLYAGDKETTAVGPDGFVHYVYTNNTIEFLWSIFKPFIFEESSSIEMIYVGFENGKFIGYKKPSPGNFVYMYDGNSSCPDWNIEIHCRKLYTKNSTNPVTGKISGPVTIAQSYDPRWRPWYIASLEDNVIWTEPYVFAENGGVLGITAAQQIITHNGEIIGVIGTDYTLEGIQNVLIELIDGDNSILIFIVDNSGKLIAASIEGAAIDENLNQVFANTSDYSRISKVAQLIQRDRGLGGMGGWDNVNNTVMAVDIEGEGLYLAKSTQLDDERNLGWHLVVVETVSCEYGYYPSNRKVFDFNNLKVCERCPNGAECVGGSLLPYPKEGYWIDLDPDALNDYVFSCSWGTCTGFRDRVKGDYSELLLECWTNNVESNRSVCNLDNLICAEGSRGPLCGSCLSRWRYSSISGNCVKCGELVWLKGFVFMAVLVISLTLLYQVRNGYVLVPKLLQPLFGNIFHVQVIGILAHIDSGSLKVLWATFQIVQSISFSVNIIYPDPYAMSMSFLSFLELDILSVPCFDGNYLNDVIYTSISLFILGLFGWFVFCFRVLYRGAKFGFHSRDWRILWAQHCQASLLLIYVMVPPVISKQFKALDCQTFSEDRAYLRVDTSVNCTSRSYQSFVVLDSLLIAIYLSLSWLYIILLYRDRGKLNPDAPNLKIALQIRERDESLGPVQFLFRDYKPKYWFFEITDLYRRILFVSVLPLLSQRNSTKAYLGGTFALFSTIYFRELMPYRIEYTNCIAVVAQYVILIDFMAALVLDARSLDSFNMDRLQFGILLFSVNVVIVVMALYVGQKEYLLAVKKVREEQDRALKLENGVLFTRDKFKSVLKQVVENEVTSGHILCYYYTSLEQALTSLRKQQIPALSETKGVMVSLNGPMDIGENDPSLKFMPLATSREAVICVSVPSRFLFRPPAQVGLLAHMRLRLIPEDVLFSMGTFVTPKRHRLKSSFGFLEGGMPATVQHDADLSSEDSDSSYDSMFDEPPPPQLSLLSLVSMKERSEEVYPVSGTPSSLKPGLARSLGSKRDAFSEVEAKSNNDSSQYIRLNIESCAVRAFQLNRDCSAPTLSTDDGIIPSTSDYDPYSIELIKPKSLIEYTSAMKALRNQCYAEDNVLVYHYTSAGAAPFIFEHGFKMSSNQGEGGIFFSILSPSSYGLGTIHYETNIIVDCYGEEKINELQGKHKLDVVFVYGINPKLLEPLSERRNSFMINKEWFFTFGKLSTHGEYFLRPDLIKAAFLFDTSFHAKTISHFSEAKQCIQEEKSQDTKHRFHVEKLIVSGAVPLYDDDGKIQTEEKEQAGFDGGLQKDSSTAENSGVSSDPIHQQSQKHCVGISELVTVKNSEEQIRETSTNGDGGMNETHSPEDSEDKVNKLIKNEMDETHNLTSTQKSNKTNYIVEGKGPNDEKKEILREHLHKRQIIEPLGRPLWPSISENKHTVDSNHPSKSENKLDVSERGYDDELVKKSNSKGSTKVREKRVDRRHRSRSKDKHEGKKKRSKHRKASRPRKSNQVVPSEVDQNNGIVEENNSP